jgi:hypothetical protein
MKTKIVVGAIFAATLAMSAAADDALKSGLQPGKSPSPFHPLNVTGSAAGKKQCLV